MAEDLPESARSATIDRSEYACMSTRQAEALAGSLESTFQRHAIVTWIGIPLLAALEVIPALGATCRYGYPDWSLLVVLAIEAHHVYCEGVAWKAARNLLSPPEQAVVARLGVFRKRKWKVLQGVLESIDLYTDLTFPFIARACGYGPLRDLSGVFAHAWRKVPLVGPTVASLVLVIRFWGLCFIASGLNVVITGWIGFFQQRMHESSRRDILDMKKRPSRELSRDRETDYFYDSLTGEVYFGWAQAAETAMLPSVAALCEEMAIQKRYTFDHSKDAVEAMLARVQQTLGEGMGHAEAKEMGNEEQRIKVEQAAQRHYLLLLLVKVFVGNVVLLWLQASFYAITFEFFNDEARLKLVASMVISVVQAAARCASVMAKLPGPGTVVSAVIMFFVAFSLAKVYFAHQCPEHVWNLTTGCVDLSSFRSEHAS